MTSTQTFAQQPSQAERTGFAGNLPSSTDPKIMASPFIGTDLGALLRQEISLGAVKARALGRATPEVTEVAEGIVRFDTQHNGHGRHAMITGGMHGNEPCGVAALLLLARELAAGDVPLLNGSVTFALANLAALKENVRPTGPNDMNRAFLASAPPDQSTALGARVQALKDQVKFGIHCLDLHSVSSPSAPMGICGLGRELDTVLLPVERIVVFDLRFQSLVAGSFIGWAVHRGASSGLVVECGQHIAPDTFPFAYLNARTFLDSVGLTLPPGHLAPRFRSKQFFKVIEIDPAPALTETQSAQFQFLRTRQGFEPVRAGELLGHYTVSTEGVVSRHEARHAAHDGVLIMPAAGQNLNLGYNYFIAQPYVPFKN